MSDGQADIAHREIIFHNDNETPLYFLLDLLHSVFNKPLADAFRLTEAAHQEGKASCGSYPGEVASELLESARRRIDESGYPLRITSRRSVADEISLESRCKVCGTSFSTNGISLKGTFIVICDDCLDGIKSHVPEAGGNKSFGLACHALSAHFTGIPLDQLVATSRTFPGHMRADVQAGVDKLFSTSPLRFFGIHEEYRYETLTIASLSRNGRNAPAIAPAQYHEVDVGEATPVRCLDNGLWLCRKGKLRYAVVLSSHRSIAGNSRPASRSRCPPAPRAQSSCNAASPNWKVRSTTRAATAARCSRSMATETIADGHEASWCTNCRRSVATTSSCPRQR